MRDKNPQERMMGTYLREVELRLHRRRRRDGRVEQVGVLEPRPAGEHAGVGPCNVTRFGVGFA